MANVYRIEVKVEAPKGMSIQNACGEVKTLDDYRISGHRLRSVDHCTKVGLPYVSMDSTPIGEPVGWCPDEDLGGFSRGSRIYSGLYIHHPEFGDCWGHVLTQQLPQIFDLD